MATRKSITKAQSSNVVSHDIAMTAIAEAVASITAQSKCAATLDGIVTNWSRFDGRSARTPDAMKAHCAKLGMTTNQGKEVQKWLKAMKDGAINKALEMRAASKLPPFKAEELDQIGRSFVQSIKVHSAAYFVGKTESAKRKARGAAAKQVKPKAKAKAKATPQKPLAEVAGASPKALHAHLIVLLPAFDTLINARGVAGLATDTLDKCRETLQDIAEKIGKMK